MSIVKFTNIHTWREWIRFVSGLASANAVEALKEGGATLVRLLCKEEARDRGFETASSRDVLSRTGAPW